MPACEDPRVHRAPLVRLPPELAPPGAAVAVGVGASRRAWIAAGTVAAGAPASCWGSTAARRRRSRRCSTSRRGSSTSGTRGRATRTRSARRPPSRRCSGPPMRRSSAPASMRISSARRCWRSPAPTPTPSPGTCAAARTADWIVVNDVVGAWATATGRGPVSARSRAPAPTCSAWASTGAPGAQAAGAICSATRAAATGLAIESIKAALRDRDGSGPQTALSEAAAAFFCDPEHRGACGTRLLKAAHQGRDRRVRDRDGQARGAAGTRLRARSTGAAPSVLGGQIAAVIRRTGLATPGETAAGGRFPVGLIGSAFRAGAVFVEPLARGRLRGRAASARRGRGDGAGGREPACWRRAPAGAVVRVADGARAGDRLRACRSGLGPRRWTLRLGLRPRAGGPRSRVRPPIACAPAPAIRTAAAALAKSAARSAFWPSVERDEEGGGEHVTRADVLAHVRAAPPGRSPRALALPQDHVSPPPAVIATTVPALCAREMNPAQTSRSCTLITIASQSKARRERSGRSAAVRGGSPRPPLRPSTCARAPAASARGSRRSRASAGGSPGRRAPMEDRRVDSSVPAIGPAHASTRWERSHRSPRSRAWWSARRRLDLELELCAVGLHQLLDHARRTAREDQRPPAQPGRLQGAVEGAAAGAARAVGSITSTVTCPMVV